MRFFHLSDLHIGLKLMNRDLREDQEYILRQVVALAKEKQPDAVVIAGDIYDKAVPSAEAVEIFDGFIAQLTTTLPDAVIMMISGNHDSAPRVDCFRSVLSKQKVYMIGQPPRTEQEFIEKVTLEDAYGKVNFYLLPFVKPSMVKQVVGTDADGNNLSYNDTVHQLIAREDIHTDARNVLVSHQFYLPKGTTAEEMERMDSEIRTVGNIDEVRGDVLEQFDYAALGHIHKPMQIGGERYRYCGTPLACSVSEAGQEKGIIMVDMMSKQAGGDDAVLSKGKSVETERMTQQQYAKTNITVLPLKPLHAVRMIQGTLEEVLKQGCQDYVTVVLTDKVDLDVIDMQERVRIAFPNLLEIRREHQRKANYEKQVNTETILNPYELCCAFMNNLDAEDKAILQDVVNTVKGAM